MARQPQTVIDQALAVAKRGEKPLGEALQDAWGTYSRGGLQGNGLSVLDGLGIGWVLTVRETLKQIGLSDSRIINAVDYSIEGKGTVLNLLIPDYYIYIDKGRRAGARMPPALPIIEWMQRKGIARGRENRVSWAIRMAIARDGIKPRPFVQRAIGLCEGQAVAVLGAGMETLVDVTYLRAIAGE